MAGPSSTQNDQPSGGTPGVEWFVGRDGQQHGPLSDIEFHKLLELGHLRPTDLVWREGFSEWRTAQTIIDARRPVAQPPPPPQSPPHGYAPAGHDPYRGRSAAPGGVLQTDGATATPAQGSTHTPRQGSGVAAGHHSQNGAQAPEGAHGHVQSPKLQAPIQTASRGQPQSRPQPQPQPHSSTPVDSTGSDYDDDDVEATGRGTRGRGLKIAAIVAFFAITLSAVGWLALSYRTVISRTMSSIIPASGGNAPASVSSRDYAALAGFTAESGQVDGVLQGSPLFKLLKRTHADWYKARVDEAAKLAAANAGDAKIVETLVTALVQLRRQHAGDVLSATQPKLLAIASAFVSNLAMLRGAGVEQCYKFISNGEAAPGIMPLFQSPGLSGPLQRQLHMVFLAVEEGRATPRVYPMPRQSDYTALLAELEARGWKQADMQLFSDSRALAKAAPQDVCRLVTEWFESQLALKDQDIQLRLIADSLKPLIAG